jgi:hypothetical protein
MRHFYVGAPAKLTLAPLLVDAIVSAIDGDPPMRRPALIAGLETSDQLDVIGERWISVRLRPVADLLDLVRDPKAELAALA